MRAHEVARPGALLAVGADELAVLGIPHEAITLDAQRTRMMPIGDNDVAVRRADARCRTDEGVFTRLLDARLANGQQQLALWAELMDHIGFLHRLRIGGVERAAVPSPEVAIPVATKRVNGAKHALGHGLDHVACR